MIFKIAAGSARPTQRGVTMIEVLIAVLVLSVGLLGMAALQGISVQTNQSANFRSHATMLVNEMMENMRSNRTQLVESTVTRPGPPPVTERVWYVRINVSSYAIGLGDAPSTTDPVILRQLNDWLARLAQLLPGAQAAIAVANNRDVTVTIQWLDQRFAARFGVTGTGAENATFAVVGRM